MATKPTVTAGVINPLNETHFNTKNYCIKPYKNPVATAGHRNVKSPNPVATKPMVTAGHRNDQFFYFVGSKKMELALGNTNINQRSPLAILGKQTQKIK